jgi:hypothetical protein
LIEAIAHKLQHGEKIMRRTVANELSNPLFLRGDKYGGRQIGGPIHTGEGAILPYIHLDGDKFSIQGLNHLPVRKGLLLHEVAISTPITKEGDHNRPVYLLGKCYSLLIIPPCNVIKSRIRKTYPGRENQ